MTRDEIVPQLEEYERQPYQVGLLLLLIRAVLHLLRAECPHCAHRAREHD